MVIERTDAWPGLSGFCFSSFTSNEGWLKIIDYIDRKVVQHKRVIWRFVPMPMLLLHGLMTEGDLCCTHQSTSVKLLYLKV